MIPYGRQHISQGDIDAVEETLRSDFLTCGPQVEEFERSICEVTGARYAVACSNGTAALHLACLALGVSSSSLALTSPITFVASANCVEFCGGQVDFVDIDPQSLCLSPEALQAYCEAKRVPAVVVPVSFSGIVADLPALWALKQKYGFLIIEDAAHSFGSTYSVDGQRYSSASCAHSDCAILSFHPVKTVTTGEGGAVTTNSPAIAEKLRLARAHGIERTPTSMSRCDGPWYYEMQSLGFNYRITDIQCALGVSQTLRLGDIRKRRREIADTYTRSFARYRELVTPHIPEGQDPCLHLYPLQLAGGAQARSALFKNLLSVGIRPQVHYIPVYWQPYYRDKYGFKEGYCPNAEKYYSGCISLPLYIGLADSEIEYVTSSVLRFSSAS